jgi:hypothetical protein
VDVGGGVVLVGVVVVVGVGVVIVQRRFHLFSWVVVVKLIFITETKLGALTDEQW